MTPRPPADQAVRTRVVTDFDTTLLLEAGAGTGKTTVLVSRILALLRKGKAPIDRIVAITFTEKAAGELKSRLRDEIERALEEAAGEEAERLVRARDDLERAPVSTIHAFGASLLRERPFEAGLDPGFAVAADVASDRTFEDAWEAWLRERMTEGDPVLVRAMACDLKLTAVRQAARIMVGERDVLGLPEPEPAFGPEGLLDRLREAVRTLGPLKGSCTDRENEAYQNVLDLEADLQRAERLDPTSRERFLRELKISPNKGRQDDWDPKAVCKAVKDELKAVKLAQEAWLAASDAHVAWAVRDRLRGFLDAYESAKRDAAVVDFQDLLLRTRDVLTRDPAVRRYFQERFDHVLVDEFQDTDPLQVEIAFLLAEDERTGPAPTWRDVRLKPGKLFLVGDPKQSIYRFRRADLALYQEAKRLVRASGGEVLALDTSFRTVPSIVGFVNGLFETVFQDREVDPDPLPLTAYRPEVARSGRRTVALTVPKERLPEDGDRRIGSVAPVVARTIAAFLAEITRDRPWSLRDGDSDRIRPARPGDVALLVRKTTPEFLGPVEAALAAHGVPYRIVGGKEYFVRDEVRALTAVLRAIDNPADRLALFAALRSPFFAFSDDDLWQYVAGGGALSYQAPLAAAARNADVVAPAFDLLKRLHRLRRVRPPSDVILALFERTRALAGFRLRASGDQIVANLWKALELARAYEAAGPTTLREVVRFLGEEEEAGGDEGDSPVGEERGAQVAVVTVHSAKGLEYPIVVLGDILTSRAPGREVVVDHAARKGWLKIGGFKPAGWSEADAIEKRQAEAEERRLLYVALTRAKDHLVIPRLEGEEPKGWAAAAVAALQTSLVTVFDSGGLRFDPPAPEKASLTAAIEGGDAEAQEARDAEARWARVRVEAKADPVESDPGEDGEPVAAPRAAPEADLGEEAARFGSLVHRLLALPDPIDDGALEEAAAALRAEHGLGSEDARE
ncbi:MAG TPA: UvrD-helicase domain-containing protein, partial [Vicinamibacteria bacterium]